MQILHDFLRSDALLVMQFLTTLGLLVFALVFFAQVTSRQRMLARDNADLREELVCLRERREQSTKRLTDEQRRHRDLLAKIGDDIYDLRPLTEGDFDCVREMHGSNSVRLTIDLSDADEQMNSQSSNDPRFIDADLFVEPAANRATVTAISGLFNDSETPADVMIDDDSDPLTRALKISKAIGRD